MLDLSFETRRLTQGQPPAEMTLAIQRQGAAAGAPPRGAAPASPVPAAASSGSAPDPRAVARRVYDLMCQELAVHRDRCGPRQW